MGEKIEKGTGVKLEVKRAREKERWKTDTRALID